MQIACAQFILSQPNERAHFTFVYKQRFSVFFYEILKNITKSKFQTFILRILTHCLYQRFLKCFADFIVSQKFPEFSSMFPTRILTRLVSRRYLCSFDRKKVDFDFTKDFLKLLTTFIGKLREIKANFYVFREISQLEPCKNFLEVTTPHLTLLKTLLKSMAKRYKFREILMKSFDDNFYVSDCT